MQTILEVDRMFRLPDAGNMLAFVDVVINEAIVIRGIRVLRGKDGVPFVSMPQEQGKDNKWYEQVVLRDDGVRKAVHSIVLDHYNKGV